MRIAQTQLTVAVPMVLPLRTARTSRDVALFLVTTALRPTSDVALMESPQVKTANINCVMTTQLKDSLKYCSSGRLFVKTSVVEKTLVTSQANNIS